MKRLFALALAFALVLSLAGAATASEAGKYSDLVPGKTEEPEAKYSSTQSFLDALTAQELVYEYGGLSDSGAERVFFDYPGDYRQSIRIVAFFGKSESDVNFRVWNLIDFNSSDTGEILKLLNTLNSSFNYACFTVDESDYSVTVMLDALLPDEGGEMALQYLSMLGRIADRGYQVLETYAK